MILRSILRFSADLNVQWEAPSPQPSLSSWARLSNKRSIWFIRISDAWFASFLKYKIIWEISSQANQIVAHTQYFWMTFFRIVHEIDPFGKSVIDCLISFCPLSLYKCRRCSKPVETAAKIDKRDSARDEESDGCDHCSQPCAVTRRILTLRRRTFRPGIRNSGAVVHDCPKFNPN